MKRSRAFILSEQLLAILLQAGFILVLCMSFYLLTTFYAQSQQIMTARNHAERVISFVDNKIRYAGLGLWRCGSPKVIWSRLDKIEMLRLNTSKNKAYKLPISLKWVKDGVYKNTYDIPIKDAAQREGDMLTLLYAQKDLSTLEDSEVISAFQSATQLIPETYSSGAYAGNVKGTLPLLDASTTNLQRITESKLFKFRTSNIEKNIKKYAVMESLGFPMCLNVYVKSGNIHRNLPVCIFNVPEEESNNIVVPAGGELMGLNCMQMFVHGTDGVDEGRQFAYRELQEGGAAWDKTYNQEKNILDIYMKRDKDNNTFTLWVLATGGYDANLNNPRPETWPDNANPRLSTYDSDKIQTAKDAKEAWDNSDYRHHIVYVSRASWKLNNLEKFNWGDD